MKALSTLHLRSILKVLLDLLCSPRTMREGREIVEQMVRALARIPDVEVACAYLVDEDTQMFEPAACHPPDRLPPLRQEVDALIDSGVFAWSLDQPRSVVVEAHTIPGSHVLLSPLATADRIMGMLVLLTTQPAGFVNPLIPLMVDALGAQAALILRYEAFRRHFERVLEERTQAIRASEQTFREIFDFAREPILILDLEDRSLLFANKEACRVFGLRREEDPQAKDTHTPPFWEGPAFWPGLLVCEQEGEAAFPWILEREGGRIHFQVHASLLHLWGRKVAHCLFHDISEIKRVEEMLRRAKAEAEEASRLKSEFLATMSHEIRTPLHGVLGMTALALETELTPEQREYLESIQACATSLMDLLNDILDFSKIEAGRIELERIPLDLREEVERVRRSVAYLAEQKGLELRCVVGPEVPDRIWGDPARLRQVLLNLVHNAVKFTHNGWVELRVEAESGDPLQLRFSVTDTGIGIPRDRQRHIFEKFTQADSSTTRRYGGTGMGLAIASRLVALMGGSIHLISQEGRGSRFWFVLPVEVALEAAQDPGAGQGGDQREGEGSAPAPLRILLVEDHPVNRRVAEAFLQKAGHQVTAVAGGREAVEAFREALQQGIPYDLIFMDVQMPEMDGYATTRSIRELEARAGRERVPIVAMTAHVLKGDRERCLDVGMDDYLPKPVDPQRLQEMVRRWGKGKESSNGAACPLNLEQALRRFGEDRGFFQEMLGIFLDRVQSQIQTLREALLQGDQGRIQEEAHSIKGAARTLEALAVTEAARALEQAAREGASARIPDLLARLEHALEALRAWAATAGWLPATPSLQNPGAVEPCRESQRPPAPSP